MKSQRAYGMPIFFLKLDFIGLDLIWEPLGTIFSVWTWFGTLQALFSGLGQVKIRGSTHTARIWPNFSILIEQPWYNMAIWSRSRILAAILDRALLRTGRFGT